MGNQGRLLGGGVISAGTPVRGGGQATFGRHLMTGAISGVQRHDRLAQVELHLQGTALCGLWCVPELGRDENLSPQQPVPFSATRDPGPG